MGTIATKLEYLNTTKEKIRDSINLTGANIGTSDTFRSYASKLKKGYIDIINNGIDTLYNNFPKVSGIGSNLSLTPTYEAPMKLNEIQGDTLQDGTPTPNTPVPIQSVTGLQNVNVCGKNLFNKDSGFINAYIDTSGVIHDNVNSNALFTYIKVQSNTTYTFSCNTSLRNLGINEFNSSKTFILRTQSQNVSSLTITTSSTTNYLRLQINYDNTTSITQAIIDSLNLQLEQGSATEYEPYKGNTYEVNLGKNLFDKDNANIINCLINGQTGVISSNSNCRTLYIKCNTNTTYTISRTIGARFIIGTSTNIPVAGVACNQFLGNNSASSLTITTRENDNYLCAFYYLNGTDTLTEQEILDSIQIEVGSIASSYSSYFTPIELNKIGDYKDSIKKSTGKNIITTYNYASSGYINYNYDNSKIGKTMTYSFIPNFSTTNASLYIRANTSISSYKVGTISTITSGTKVSVTFTLTDEQYDTIKNTNGGYIQVYKSGVSMDENSISNPMLEINSQSTSYEPYGKVWYIEKQIGKVVLDGTENGWSYNDVNAVFIIPDLVDYIRTGFIPYSNYYKGANISVYSQLNNNEISFLKSTSQNRILIKNTNYTGVTAFKNWLNSNNVTVYYVLATPTYTEITNTELIEDLETLYTAKSQEGTTNISITSEDLEMILNVSALKGEV